MYFGIISKLSYFCCAVHLLSYYIWSFCALAKFAYFVIFCILDNRCKRLKFNQYTFNKTTARPFFSVQSGSATKPALKLRTRTRGLTSVGGRCIPPLVLTHIGCVSLHRRTHT